MKTHWPFGGFFLKPSDEKNGTHEYEDYLKECEEEKQLPEEDLEFHCSKDPKKMTMQESQEEIGKFLRWNKMTSEERRAELEAQKAATCDTEQAAGDMPCAIEPESASDTPQGAVLDEAVDAPPGVDSVPGDVSGDAPESAADTVLDNVPDATEGYVPDTIGALKAPEKEAVNATAQGVIAPETTTAETLMQQGAEPTRQAAEPEAEAEGISSPQTPEPTELQEGCCAVQEAEEAPEVEVVPAEAIVPLGQIGGDAPVEEERWAYASELIGDAFQHWGNGRVLLDMGTGRGKSEFVIRKMAGWAVDQFLKGNYDNRILMICPLTLLHEDLEKRRRAEYLMVFGDDSEEGWDLYKEVLTVITYQKLEQLCKGDVSDQRILQELLDRHRIIIADECHYWSEFSAFNINTHYSLDALLQAEKDHTVVYMSATGRDTWKLLEEKGGPTQSERIYRLPQYYEYVKAAYFYARHNLVTILKRLPTGEKAIVFMELGDDLAEIQVCDPALQPTNRTADGLHQAIGGANIPVQVAEKSFHSTLFHLVCGGTEMHGRYLLDALSLKGAQVNTFRAASRFQIAVGNGLPAMPPDLGILLVVPVHRVFLVTLPVAGSEPDALTVLVKVVHLSGFREPLAVFIYCPERQQNVSVWVSISLVVDGKVGNHPFGNKLLLTKLFYHGQILLLRHLHRERQHDAPGKLGVPLVLHSFYGVPEGRPVCISGRRMGRQHDLGVDKLFLLVVEFRFLVVLAEQPFAALVSGPGNSGLPLAALDDGDFEMRTRNRHHPQTKRPPSKIALDERSGIVFGFARRLGTECHALRS